MLIMLKGACFGNCPESALELSLLVLEAGAWNGQQNR